MSEPASGHFASTSCFDLFVKIYAETQSLKEFIHYLVLHSQFLYFIHPHRRKFHILSLQA